LIIILAGGSTVAKKKESEILRSLELTVNVSWSPALVCSDVIVNSGVIVFRGMHSDVF
jgi:hypothetical protein